MNLRTILVGLIVLATAAFVVGSTLERNESHHESAATLKAEGKTSEAHAGKGESSGGEGNGESAAQHAGEGGSSAETKAKTAGTEQHPELKPLGINIEAVPFVVLAAIGSLALAAGAWLRPRWVLLLIGVALAMLVFAALDVREVFHQSDESRTGLAVLAGAIAALHLAVVIIAGLMVRGAAGPGSGPSAPAAPMGA
jgi:hypothetical protein